MLIILLLLLLIIIMASLLLSFYVTFNIMGSNTSKIKDILFVTGESLDSPDLHARRQYRPTKEVEINYKTFTPQNYYKEDATDEELNRHLQELQRKQKLLKQFKHHKDFDRIDYKKMNDQITIFELFSEDLIKYTIAGALIFSRIMAVQFTSDYFTVGGWRRLVWPCFSLLLPSAIWRMSTTQEYHVINHEYFRMLPDEESMYVQLDQKFNLYKDVENMKFNFKYSSLGDYFKTRRNILQTVEHSKKNWYKEMFLYEHGLKVDPLQEFAKAREGKRIGNWDILTESEKEQIQKELRELSNSLK